MGTNQIEVHSCVQRVRSKTRGRDVHPPHQNKNQKKKLFFKPKDTQKKQSPLMQCLILSKDGRMGIGQNFEQVHVQMVHVKISMCVLKGHVQCGLLLCKVDSVQVTIIFLSLQTEANSCWNIVTKEGIFIFPFKNDNNNKNNNNSCQMIKPNKKD